MGRTPAVQLAPGVWPIPTAPADLVNSFAPEIRDNARRTVQSFLRDKAVAR